MKKNTKYIVVQIFATVLTVFLILFMFFVWASLFGSTPDLIEQPKTQHDGNINAIFNILTGTISTIIIAIFSIYNLHLLRKRKKTRDFSPLKKKEIILLLLPILYYPVMFVWSYMWIWILSPFMAQAVTVIDLSNNQALCCDVAPEPSIFGIKIITSTITWLAFPIMFAPWFSFIGYMRKKALKK